MQYNFIVGPCDTDSVSFCKPDMSPLTEEEQKKLLKELNTISPEFMEWEDDGYYDVVIALKAKNYILYDGNKKIKGSAFKSSGKEPAMKDLMQDIIDSLIKDDKNTQSLQDIYHKYVKEAVNPTDLKRWSKKLSVTDSILKCKDKTLKDIEEKTIRLNEYAPWQAIKHIEGIQEGDKFYILPVVWIKETKVTVLKNGRRKYKDILDYGYKIVDEFDVNQDIIKIDIDSNLKRCYNTMKIFDSILDVNNLFTNYSLSKNQEKLEEILKNE